MELRGSDELGEKGGDVEVHLEGLLTLNSWGCLEGPEMDGDGRNRPGKLPAVVGEELGGTVGSRRPGSIPSVEW